MIGALIPYVGPVVGTLAVNELASLGAYAGGAVASAAATYSTAKRNYDTYKGYLTMFQPRTQRRRRRPPRRIAKRIGFRGSRRSRGRASLSRRVFTRF